MAEASLNRRSMIAGLGGAIAAWPIASSAQAPPQRHGFLVETGTRGFGDYGVGVLLCTAPNNHLARLRTLRARAWFKPQRVRGYHRPLRYGSTDRYRLDFVRLAINYFRDRPDMFVSQIRMGSGWPDAASARDAVQLQVYLRMLAQIPSALRANLRLHVIRRSIDGRDLDLLNMLPPRFSALQILQDGHNYDDLMALAAVIVGSVNAEQSRVSTHDTKSTIRSNLRAALGVQSLRPNQLNSTNKIRSIALA